MTGAVGDKAFVEDVFQSSPGHFSPKRKQGPHPVRGLAAESPAERLYNLRQLQKNVFR